MPYINLKTTRIRGKNTLMPTLMKKNHSEYLCYSWLYKGALTKKKRSFEENLLTELVEASEKKSYSFKKCQEIYKLAEVNMVQTRRS
jgi:ribosomal protein S7